VGTRDGVSTIHLLRRRATFAQIVQCPYNSSSAKPQSLKDVTGFIAYVNRAEFLLIVSFRCFHHDLAGRIASHSLIPGTLCESLVSLKLVQHRVILRSTEGLKSGTIERYEFTRAAILAQAGEA
jgi:hypothetical protein